MAIPTRPQKKTHIMCNREETLQNTRTGAGGNVGCCAFLRGEDSVETGLKILDTFNLLQITLQT